MAEVKNEDEAQQQQQQQQQQQHAHGIPPKRKTDLTSIDEDKDENGLKKQRLENSAEKTCSSPALEKKIDGEDEEDDDEEDYEEEEDDDEGEDEDEDDEDEDEDFDEEHSNGKMAEVDRKGKGILKEDKKGKGKLIQESDDDSSDDGGDGVESDGGGSSDLCEDPLAEVDLDNILPSRTRRPSTFHPGLCLSKNERDP